LKTFADNYVVIEENIKFEKGKLSESWGRKATRLMLLSDAGRVAKLRKPLEAK